MCNNGAMTQHRFVGTRPEAASFDAVTVNEFPWMKPRGGGLWTSPPINGHVSAWIEWMTDNGFDSPPWPVWALTPIYPRVFTIDCQDDLVWLVDTYRHSHVVEHFDDKPAWDQIAEDFDAVTLTEEGLWRTHLPTNGGPDLYGWDCASTLWLNWCFDDITYLGVTEDGKTLELTDS